MEERTKRVLVVDKTGHDFRAIWDVLMLGGATHIDVEHVNSRRSAVKVLTKGDHDCYIVVLGLGRRWGLNAFADVSSASCRPVLFLDTAGRNPSDEVQPSQCLTKEDMTPATLALRIHCAANATKSAKAESATFAGEPALNTT